jgi:pseudouridine synthase
MKKRLQTVLAHAGIASRRKAAEMISEGRVTVNGKKVLEKGYRADPCKDIVKVDGKAIEPEIQKYYYVLNKPEDVISTVKDTHGRRKVADLFTGIDARLYPVGRLDKDTTGVLIVTNDGYLTNRLSHPSSEVKKEYLVVCDNRLSPSDIRGLEKGVPLDGKKTSPCSVSAFGGADGEFFYRIVIHEGRKRQIKRMFAAKGARVLRLHRSSYAGVKVSGLKKGSYRRLTGRELKKLRAAAGVE